MAIDLNDGLVGAWYGNVPEYPDNPAGTTYFQDEWATTDGWTGNGAISTLSLPAPGIVRSTATVNEWYLLKDAAWGSSRTIRIKVRSSVTRILDIRGTVGGVANTIISNTITAIAGKWVAIDVYVPGAITSFYIRPSTFVSAGDWAEIDWVYIGDGSYSTKALDASGNGNHATIYGATPVEGISRRALAFDGVNDYCTIHNPQSTAYSLCAWYKRAGTGSAQTILYTNRSVVGGKLIIRIGTDNKINALCVDSSQATQTITGPVTTTDLEFVSLVHTGSAMSLYVNGALISTVPATLTSEHSAIARIGVSGTALAQFFSGTIAEPRIYDRALSAAEITALADDPAAYAVDYVTRSTTSTPNSLAARDADGDLQARQLVSDVATGTAPLSVSSTTKVTNLNVDKIDGLDSTDFTIASGTVAQTIGGVKTFSSIPILPGSNPTLSNQAARKAYIDGKVPGVITISTSAPSGGADGDIWFQV